MNQERKALWTAALRSGEYKQGEGRLVTEVDGVREYCCLGVACEVFLKETGRGEWCADEYHEPNEGVAFRVDDMDSWSDLPTPVVEWYGLTRSPAVEYGSRRYFPLMELNDEEGLPFEAIADLIDEQL